MEVQVAVLADCANVAAGDKLNILGVFDTIFAGNFPAVHPFMALALRLRLDFEDKEKNHSLVISLQDEDGKEYVRGQAEVKVGPVPAGKFAHVNQVLNFAGMGFTKEGHYAFHLIWDGEEKGRVDLNIQRGTSPA